MPIPQRTYTVSGGSNYRYGFNGKENDNEVKGAGNQQDYGMRIYDPRLGRFLSRDPLANSFPALTPYQFAGNTPIQAIDLDGGEPLGFMEYWQARTDPYMTKWGYTVQDFYDYETKQVWTVSNYPNTNQYFYWQTKYEGANALFSPQNTNLNKGPDKDWTGTFKQFIPQHQSAIADGACNIILSSLGVGVATPFIAAAGVGVVGAAEGALTNLATQTVMAYYRWAPTVGIVGRQVAGLLDESGGVGAENAALSKMQFNPSSFADEILNLNRMTEGGGVLLNGTPSSAINTASYYETAAEQGASVFRTIISNHMFADGNKRTAVGAFQSFAKQFGLQTVDESEMFEIANKVATNELSDVSEISKKLIKADQ